MQNYLVKIILRLFSIKTLEDSPNLWMTPNILLQKFPAPEFSATTEISLFPEEAEEGKRAGLIVMGMDYATLTLTHDEKGFIIKQTEAIDAIDGNEEVTIVEKRIDSNKAVFRVEVSAPDAICQFSYSENGKDFTEIGKAFKAQPGKWIGAKVGLFSVSTQEAKRGGYADFQYFRITK